MKQSKYTHSRNSATTVSREKFPECHGEDRLLQWFEVIRRSWAHDGGTGC
jgi:hypothetical protein